MKELEKKIKDFASEKGEQTINVLESLLDYIIGFFDFYGKPVEGWKYKGEDNARFHDMMCIYFDSMNEILTTRTWYDAWGDMFMSLVTNGGGKGQFFTPQNVCQMMTDVTLNDEPQAKQMTKFGTRVVVSDCACGSSRNLLAAHAKFVDKGWKQPYLVAEDIDLLCCKMSAVNMMTHGCFGEVICHDALCEPNKVRYGYIVNETMYPFFQPVPSITRSNEAKDFFCTKLWQGRNKASEAKETVSKRIIKNEHQQLKLF